MHLPLHFAQVEAVINSVLHRRDSDSIRFDCMLSSLWAVHEQFWMSLLAILGSINRALLMPRLSSQFVSVAVQDAQVSNRNNAARSLLTPCSVQHAVPRAGQSGCQCDEGTEFTCEFQLQMNLPRIPLDFIWCSAADTD